MNLIIVESPTKARTLSRFLDNGYQIEATMGHIRDLPKNKLGVDVEHDFKPEYAMVKDRKDRISELKRLAGGASAVILATDPDREGEAIAWHVANVLGKWEIGNGKWDVEVGSENFRSKKSKNQSVSLQNPASHFSHHTSRLQRIVFHEITESAIKAALLHPRGIDRKLVDAQIARRVLDRLVGYKLSPLLWYKVRKGLSAGRVQSVAVRLIVDREREIEAFIPVEYWVIEAELEKRETGKEDRNLKLENSSLKPQGSFLARLVEKDGKKLEIGNKSQADGVVHDLEKAHYVVSNVEKKDMRRWPYPPFTTSTLQQAAANRLGWSAKKTMMVAQNLYEEGLITYHRTDSTNIAASAIDAVRAYINKVYGTNYLPPQPRFYKTKSKVAQEAHEAVRPTSFGSWKLEAGSWKLRETGLGRDADQLLDLVSKRFVASQMKEAVYDQTIVDITAGSYGLRANGSTIKFEGWQVLYKESQKLKVKSQKSDEENSNKQDFLDGEDNRLPELNAGENLDLIKLLPQQEFTQAAPRYNEASLIKMLEEKGIGRPSTYAPIISTIQDRQYVEKIERRLHPTELGKAVNDFLVGNFPNIVDYDFTARMEDELDSIANGEREWVPTIRAFYDPFNSHLSTVYKEAKRVKIVSQELDESCPECASKLVIRIGRFGKFVACSTYPKCKYTRQYVEKAGLPCPKCGGDVIIKKTKRGRMFYGCSNYPTCNFAAWKKEQIPQMSIQPHL